MPILVRKLLFFVSNQYIMLSGSQRTGKYLISKNLDNFFIDIRELTRFTLQFFKEVFVPPYELQETIRQCYKLGYKSLFLITSTAFITGMVFTDHSRPSLASFGATSWLPSFTGVAVIKALARAARFGRFRAGDIRSILAIGPAGIEPAAAGDRVVIDLPAVEVHSFDAYRIENLA